MDIQVYKFLFVVLALLKCCQAGSMLASQIKDNNFKISKFLISALLAENSLLKIGYLLVAAVWLISHCSSATFLDRKTTATMLFSRSTPKKRVGLQIRSI